MVHVYSLKAGGSTSIYVFLSFGSSVLSNSLGRSIEKTGKGLISKATSNKLVFIQLTCKNSLLNFFNFEFKELFETSDHQGQTGFSTLGLVGYRVFVSNTKSIRYRNLDRVFAEYIPYFLCILSNFYFLI